MDKRVRQDGFNRILLSPNRRQRVFRLWQNKQCRHQRRRDAQTPTKKNTCACQHRQTITNITSHDFHRFEQPIGAEENKVWSDESGNRYSAGLVDWTKQRFDGVSFAESPTASVHRSFSARSRHRRGSRYADNGVRVIMIFWHRYDDKVRGSVSFLENSDRFISGARTRAQTGNNETRLHPKQYK